jgi:hypothetical protein
MIKLTRVPNWHSGLTELINLSRHKPFEWGTHDCALWAADCIDIVTGVDYAKDSRGTYSTAFGALKCIASYYKSDNLKQTFVNNFGEDLHIAYARPGDVVYSNSNYEGFNVAVGICYGQHSFFVSDGEAGLSQVNTLDLDGCFRIG